jgi:hypothetical protein
MKGVIEKLTVKSFGPPAGPVTGACMNTKVLNTVLSSAPTLFANTVSKAPGVLLVVDKSIWTPNMSVRDGSFTEPSGRNDIPVIFRGTVDDGNYEAE